MTRMREAHFAMICPSIGIGIWHGFTLLFASYYLAYKQSYCYTLPLVVASIVDIGRWKGEW